LHGTSFAYLRYQYKITTLHQAVLGKCAQKSGEFVLRLLCGTKKSDALHLQWLRQRCNRPHQGAAAQELDKLPPLHLHPAGPRVTTSSLTLGLWTASDKSECAEPPGRFFAAG
jgi:hypothetical protein